MGASALMLLQRFIETVTLIAVVELASVKQFYESKI
jgi:hypothetical protein